MIIGIVGFIGSGKGTMGDILNEDHYFKKVSFAQGLKDVTSEMFGWKRDLLEGDTEESREFRETPCEYWSAKMGRPFTPREALQKVGTECGRDIFHKDFWILQLENYINKNFDELDDIVITDVRFPNEIEWIHSKGGIVVEVTRGVNPVWYYDLYENVNDYDFRKELMKQFEVHESEWAWIGQKIDFRITNNSTMVKFKKNINSVLTKLMIDDIINV